VQSHERVHALELSKGGPGNEVIIADEVADDGAVLLRHVGIVVLLPGPAAGEGDVMAPTPGQEVVIDELTAIVAVQAHQAAGTARGPRPARGRASAD
jgi:hypothetical protein